MCQNYSIFFLILLMTKNINKDHDGNATAAATDDNYSDYDAKNGD